MIDIPKYEGSYAITNDGRVWSYYKKDWMRPHKHPLGYVQINLLKDGKAKCFRVHCLVLEAYVGTRRGKNVANHKNGIRDDNRLDNLEWCTQSKNTKLGWDMGRKRTMGDQHWNSKLTEVMVKEIKSRYAQGVVTYKMLGAEYGVSRHHIGNIINGARRKVV